MSARREKWGRVLVVASFLCGIACLSLLLAIDSRVHRPPSFYREASWGYLGLVVLALDVLGIGCWIVANNMARARSTWLHLVLLVVWFANSVLSWEFGQWLRRYPIGSAGNLRKIGLALKLYTDGMPVDSLLYSRDPADLECRENLAVMWKALSAYAADNGGRFPSDLAELFPKYANDYRVLISPQERSRVTEEEVKRNLQTCYCYVPGWVQGMDDGQPLLFERTGNRPGMRTVLYVGGRVYFVYGRPRRIAVSAKR